MCLKRGREDPIIVLQAGLLLDFSDFITLIAGARARSVSELSLSVTASRRVTSRLHSAPEKGRLQKGEVHTGRVLF